MIKEAIDKILDLAAIRAEDTEDGRLYLQALNLPPKEPQATTVRGHTIQSVVDYIVGDPDSIEMKQHILHINEAMIGLQSPLFGRHKQRDDIFVAIPNAVEHRFGSWLDLEEFIQWLRTGFEMTEHLDRLITNVSHIVTGDELEIKDNGLTQTFVRKSGAATMESAELPKIINLRPFQTFPEIEQPVVSCIARIRAYDGEPEFMVKQADGGAWRLDAAAKVHVKLVEYFEDVDPDSDAVRPLIVM